MNEETSGSAVADGTENVIDRSEFKSALGRHASGVVVITADVGGEPLGLTATAFTSVSLDPPLVAFFVSAGSSTWKRLGRADRFAIHLLTEEQDDVATLFATSGADRFSPSTDWTRGPDSLPFLTGASAHLVCREERRQRIGDHWMVVGEVVSAELAERRPPLLYYQGSFGGFLLAALQGCGPL